MGAAGDLTTLAAVKLALGLVTAPASAETDRQLQGMISRISAQIRAWLGRGTLMSQSYSRLFDGTGTARLVLPDWPVTAIANMQIDGYPAIPAAPLPAANAEWSTAYGYRFKAWDGEPPGRPAVLELTGAWFRRGKGNVLIGYTAGYLATENWTVPAAAEILPAQAHGVYVADGGVSYAGGAALVAVTGNPTGGQYVPPGTLASPATYQFAAADVGAAVVISYSFVPAALEQACLDAVVASYVPLAVGAPSNIRALKAGGSEMQFQPLSTGRAGQSVYLTPAITEALWPFRKVAPL